MSLFMRFLISYNQLFDHLELSIDRLKRKKVPWKQAMLRALEAGKDKLQDYYSKATHIHGNLYAVGTILAPAYKLQFFSGRAWNENGIEWSEKYLEYLQDYMEIYKHRVSDTRSITRVSIPTVEISNVTALLKRGRSQAEKDSSSYQDELKWYLETGKYFLVIRSFCTNILIS